MSPRIPVAATWGARRLTQAEERIRESQKQGPGPWVWVGTYPTDNYTTFWSPPWQNSWTWADPPYARPAFRHSVDGRVEFTGTPDAGAATSGTVAFTLPEDWRVDQDQSVLRDVLVGSALIASRWEIDSSSGAVTITLIEGRGQLLKIKVFSDSQTLTTGDNKFVFDIDQELWDDLGNPAAANLTRAEAFVSTVSSSGTPTIQIRNRTQAADMLSTRITIDSGEFRSATAATPPVIDTGNDDVALGDMLAIDVDVAGTGAKGLGVNLTFSPA